MDVLGIESKTISPYDNLLVKKPMRLWMQLTRVILIGLIEELGDLLLQVIFTVKLLRKKGTLYI